MIIYINIFVQELSGEPRPIAGATQERKLLGVGSSAMFGWPTALSCLGPASRTPLDTSCRSPSQRKGADLVDPFFSLCGMPDQ